MATTSESAWPEDSGPGVTSATGTVEPGNRPADAATSDDDTKAVAQEQAAQLTGHAAEAGQQVLETARDQAQDVATDAKAQAEDLLGRARDEFGAQARAQRDRAVDGLRSLGTQLQSMAEGSEQSGMATRLARHGSQTSEQAATFLAEREPSQLVDEVRGFARRKPAAFLFGAALAGVVVGRFTRGMKSASSDDAPAALHAESDSDTGSGDL